jgi:hypothetical protein
VANTQKYPTFPPSWSKSSIGAAKERFKIQSYQCIYLGVVVVVGGEFTVHDLSVYNVDNERT